MTRQTVAKQATEVPQSSIPGIVRVVGLDLDGTLIRENTWELIHQAVGVPAEQNLAWYELYLSGEITYAQWLGIITRAFIERGARRATFESILTNLHLNTGCREMVNVLRQERYELAIISSSVDIVVEHVAHQLGIPSWRANSCLRFGTNGELIGIEWSASEEAAKVQHLRELSAEFGIPRSAWAYVGNASNDFKVLSAVQVGILYWHNPVLPIGYDNRWHVIEDLAIVPRLLRSTARITDLQARHVSKRRTRLSGAERRTIAFLASNRPPKSDQSKGWTLVGLAAAAKERGIEVSPRQIGRILSKEGIKWQKVQTNARSDASGF